MEPAETKPKRKKESRHGISKRKVFQQALLSKWSEETDSSNVKARSDAFFQLPDPDLEDGDKTSGDASATDVVVGATQRFRLPWMPRAAVVSELVAIGCFADALKSQESLLRMLEPAHLTHIVMPLLKEDGDAVGAAIKKTLTVWAGWSCSRALLLTEPKVVVCNEAQDTTGRVPQSLKHLGSRVENYLRAGNPVLLITASEEIFAPLRRHVGLTLRCPRINRSLDAEIICALHRKAARLRLTTVTDRLPEDHQLARLTPTQLQVALRLSAPDRRGQDHHRKPAPPLEQKAPALITGVSPASS